MEFYLIVSEDDWANSQGKEYLIQSDANNKWIFVNLKNIHKELKNWQDLNCAILRIDTSKFHDDLKEENNSHYSYYLYTGQIPMDAIKKSSIHKNFPFPYTCQTPLFREETHKAVGGKYYSDQSSFISKFPTVTIPALPMRYTTNEILNTLLNKNKPDSKKTEVRQLKHNQM